MIKKGSKRGTIVDGIAASQALDSSGEIIEIEGIDDSTLTDRGTLNWEHKSDEPNQTVGKILESKKILKRSDCENDRHRHYWDQIKIPFLYVSGELFDAEGHSGASDVAAMIRYNDKLDKRKTKDILGFSIEGSSLSKEGNRIKKCIARKVTLTHVPCNKTCSMSVMEESKSVIDKVLGKSEAYACEIIKAESKYEPKREYLSHEVPENLKVGDRLIHGAKERGKKGKEIYEDPKTFPKPNPKIKKAKKRRKIDFRSNVAKAIAASCGISVPSEKEGMAALSKEDVKKQLIRTCKSIGDDYWNTFTKKEQLIDFLTERMPNSSEKEVLAVAKTVAYTSLKKSERVLSRVINKGEVLKFPEKVDLTPEQRHEQEWGENAPADYPYSEEHLSQTAPLTKLEVSNLKSHMNHSKNMIKASHPNKDRDVIDRHLKYLDQIKNRVKASIESLTKLKGWK